MKVCIQNCLTKDYLSEKLEWDKAEANAKHFASSVEAIDYVTRHQCADCDVVLKFDPGEYDIHLSVSENCRRLCE